MNNKITLALVAAALALAACGGQGGVDETTTTMGTTTTAPVPTPTTTPATTTTTSAPTTRAGEPNVEALMASLGADTEPTSARIEGSIEISGLDDATTGVSEAVILFSTAFDGSTGNTSFSMDMSSLADAAAATEEEGLGGLMGGFFGEMEFRQIGDRVFVNFPIFSSMFGVETTWLSMPAEDGAELTGGMETVPTDPQEIIDAYGEAGASIEDLGTENVNGVDATHYRITLDTSSMDLTAQDQAELEASGLFAAGVIPLDIWIDDGGHVVRMVFEFDGSGLDAPPEEQFGMMTMRYDVYDIDANVVIQEPPGSDVTAIEDLEGAGFGLDS